MRQFLSSPSGLHEHKTASASGDDPLERKGQPGRHQQEHGAHLATVTHTRSEEPERPVRRARRRKRLRASPTAVVVAAGKRIHLIEENEMSSHSISPRRVLAVALGVGAVLLGAAAPAISQPAPPPPNCTAADLTGSLSGVTASTSVYLFTHPQVNDFLTTFGDVPDEERQARLDAFLEANPQVKSELQAIRQPPTDFRNRCGLGPARELTP